MNESDPSDVIEDLDFDQYQPDYRHPMRQLDAAGYVTPDDPIGAGLLARYRENPNDTGAKQAFEDHVMMRSLAGKELQIAVRKRGRFLARLLGKSSKKAG